MKRIDYSNIKCVFFDLDHTLWDFDKNAEETLHELYNQFALNAVHEGSVQDFVQAYYTINNRLWQQYEKGVISKDFLRTERFKLAFEQIGIDKKNVPQNIWELYLEMCPKKTNLITGAIDICDHLNGSYDLGLISNGFENTQKVKLQYSGLDKYFRKLVTSERVGHPKPKSEIYHVALAEASVNPDECIMIGDSFNNDVLGAMEVGISAIWFNPQNSTPNEDVPMISDLMELSQYL